jgi:hypothetical protein
LVARVAPPNSSETYRPTGAVALPAIDAKARKLAADLSTPISYKSYLNNHNFNLRVKNGQIKALFVDV